MVKHIIIWTLKPEFSADEKRSAAEKIKSGLEGLAGKIPGMTEVKVNIDLLSSSTGDVMLDTTFTDENALKAYQTNPHHFPFPTYVRSVFSDRKCVDFEQ